jgi:type I restriction enzyme, S subunit
MPETIKRTTGTTVAFGDVVQLSKERSKDPEADGFERYIGLEHLEPSDLKVRSWGDLTDGVTFTNVFRPGQVLFGKRRAYQRKVAIADFSGVCSGDIYVLEPKGEQLLPELLPFICQSEPFYNYVISMSQGGLSPRVNWKALAKYEFALPPLEEQRRISEALIATDSSQKASFVLAQRIIDLRSSLLAYRTGTALLTRGNSKDLNTNRYASWKRMKLSDLSKVVRGSTPRPAGDPKYFGGSHIPWITVGEITKDDSPFLESTEAMLTAAGEEKSRVFEPGTVVLSNSGATLGIPKVLRIKGCANDGVAAFLDVDSRVLPMFLYYWLSGLTEYFRNVVAAGGGQPNLNTTRIGDLFIAVPPISEQEAIVNLMEELEHSLTETRRRIVRSHAISQGILHETLGSSEGLAR